MDICNVISNKIKDEWAPPDVGLVHWDGKLMSTLDGDAKEERLPILVSGLGGTKLLGVPTLKLDKVIPVGQKIALATSNLLKDWDCEDSISGMVFDTTSVNTGEKIENKFFMAF